MTLSMTWQSLIYQSAGALGAHENFSCQAHSFFMCFFIMIISFFRSFCLAKTKITYDRGYNVRRSCALKLLTLGLGGYFPFGML